MSATTEENGIQALKNKVPLSHWQKYLRAKELPLPAATGLSTAASNALVPAILEFLTKNGRGDDVSKKPKAYLNWILLDENLKVIKDDSTINPLKRNEYSGFIPAGEEKQLKKMIKQGWKIAKSGYVYIFTSNESAETDVYYDNLMVTDVQGPLLEVNHTYPFGLTIQNISSQAPGRLENKFRFNGGNELQNNEFSDGSGLEFYDAKNRMYDPQLGRFFQIDEFGEVNEDVSSYSFSHDNPILYNDPLGLIDGLPGEKPAEIGEVVVEGYTKNQFQEMYWDLRTRNIPISRVANEGLRNRLQRIDIGQRHMDRVHEMTRASDEIVLEAATWLIPWGKVFKLGKLAKLYKLRRGIVVTEKVIQDLPYHQVQKLAGKASLELNAFFNTNGGVVPSKEALLVYRELATRMLNGTKGAYQRVTEKAAELHTERIRLIDEALELYYK